MKTHIYVMIKFDFLTELLSFITLQRNSEGAAIIPYQKSATTKDQIKYFKKPCNINKNAIIFWKGHVAVCLSKTLLIHAYGPKKKVLFMNIKKTIELIKKTAKLKVIGIR